MEALTVGIVATLVTMLALATPAQAGPEDCVLADEYDDPDNRLVRGGMYNHSEGWTGVFVSVHPLSGSIGFWVAVNNNCPIQ